MNRAKSFAVSLAAGIIIAMLAVSTVSCADDTGEVPATDQDAQQIQPEPATTDNPFPIHHAESGLDMWYIGTQGRIDSVALDFDGSRLAAGSLDGFIYLLDREGHLLWGYPTDGEDTSVAIRSDPIRVVAGSDDNHIYVLDGEGAVIGDVEAKGPVTHVAVASNGPMVVAVSDGNIYLLDLEGRLIKTISLSKGPIRSLALTPDGSRIVAGAWDHNVYILDGDGNLVGSYETGGSVLSVDVSEDGRRIAAGSSDTSVYILDGSGQRLGWYEIGRAEVDFVAMSANGSSVAAASRASPFVYLLDDTANLVWNREPWPTPKGEGWFRRTDGQSIRSLAISPDASFMAVGSWRPGQKWYFHWLSSNWNVAGWDYKMWDPAISVTVSGDGSAMAAGSKDKEHSIVYWGSP